MERYLEFIFKILLAFILGGVVGYDREFKNMPAGFRTHVLVCLGATLVQSAALNYYSYYQHSYNYDPMRLGAQVISGIGFLGAGTILKEGANIKGLTTAASVWVVACIGISVGLGLYFEAMVATMFIYFCLRWFKGLERKMIKGKRYATIKILANDQPGIIGEVTSFIGKKRINITCIDLEKIDEETVEIDITINYINMNTVNDVISNLKEFDGVHKIHLVEV